MALIDTARTRVTAIAAELATAHPPETSQGDRLLYDSYVARLTNELDMWLRRFPELANEGRDVSSRTFEEQSRVE